MCRHTVVFGSNKIIFTLFLPFIFRTETSRPRRFNSEFRCQHDRQKAQSESWVQSEYLKFLLNVTGSTRAVSIVKTATKMVLRNRPPLGSKRLEKLSFNPKGFKILERILCPSINFFTTKPLAMRFCMFCGKVFLGYYWMRNDFEVASFPIRDPKVEEGWKAIVSVSLVDVSLFFRRGGRCTFGSNLRQIIQTWGGNTWNNYSDLRGFLGVSTTTLNHTDWKWRRWET